MSRIHNPTMKDENVGMSERVGLRRGPGPNGTSLWKNSPNGVNLDQLDKNRKIHALERSGRLLVSASAISNLVAL